MNNKKLMNVVSALILSAAMVAGGVQASATTDFTDEQIYDNAPIVYVASDDELPEAYRRNMEAMKNVPYTTAEKTRAYNNYINSKKLNKDLATRAIIRPSVNIYQNPQETDYYCGYACLQSILEYHDIDMTQDEIAADAYDDSEALAWFIGTNSQATQWGKYPAAVYLSSVLDVDYRPYNSYFGTFNASVLADKVQYDVDEMEEGVLICGVSRGNDSNDSKLPGYPNYNVGHWIVADGYYWDNTIQEVIEISFVDPAKSSAISWSSSISKYSHTELDRMYNFASARGIIWCE